MRESSLTRRTVLSAIGAGFGAGLLATDATAARREESQYALVQGDKCVPIAPIRDRLPVEQFYDYQLPQEYVSDANGASVGEAAPYASAGTRERQRRQTSIAFLYDGPEGVSLVVVHGSVQATDGGAVTFQLSGLPRDGEWIVKDDRYRDSETGDLASSNYDRWEVDGTDHRIDWTWGNSGTDGGVFRDLGDDFEVTVDPAFNEDAALYDQYYEGTIDRWEFLTGGDVSDRISLSLDQPIRIRTGSCGGDTAVSGTDRQTARDDQEKEDDDREEEQQEEDDRETETQEKQDDNEHEEKEQADHEEESQETQDAHDRETETQEEEDDDREEEQQEEDDDHETETQDDHEHEEEEEQDHHEDEEENEDDHEDDDHDEGNGNGHGKGKGKGHENGKGKGHEKDDEGDDDDEDDEDDEDEDDDD